MVDRLEDDYRVAGSMKQEVGSREQKVRSRK